MPLPERILGVSRLKPKTKRLNEHQVCFGDPKMVFIGDLSTN
jgi:hypothetical protein